MRQPPLDGRRRVRADRVVWHLNARMRRFASSLAFNCENLGTQILKLTASRKAYRLKNYGYQVFGMGQTREKHHEPPFSHNLTTAKTGYQINCSFSN
jgi:hypothetical protein